MAPPAPRPTPPFRISETQSFALRFAVRRYPDTFQFHTDAWPHGSHRNTWSSLQHRGLVKIVITHEHCHAQATMPGVAALEKYDRRHPFHAPVPAPSPAPEVA